MNWKLVLVILTFNVAVMSASYTMLIPFLPLYLPQELGVQSDDVAIWSGIVFSASFAVSAVMAPVWGSMADRKGKRIMAIRAALFLAIAYCLGGIVTSPQQLTMVRVFQGFAAGLWPMELAIMTLYAPPASLGFCLGTMQGALTAGQVAGPLIGGILAQYVGMRASFFVASACLLMNCLFFVFVIKEPAAPTQAISTDRTGTAGNLWKQPLLRHVLWYAVFVQMALLILQPVLATYVSSLTDGASNVVLLSGVIFSLAGLSGMLAAPLWGKIGQKKGFFTALMWAAAGAGMAMAAQGAARSLYGFAVLQCIVGLFFAGIQPSISAVLALHTAAAAKGRVFGLLFSAQQIGSIAGPIAGGLTASWLGMTYVFFLAASLLLLTGIAVWRQRKMISAPPIPVQHGAGH